jgi:nucleoside-diphosphate-sugar epimerase
MPEALLLGAGQVGSAILRTRSATVERIVGVDRDFDELLLVNQFKVPREHLVALDFLAADPADFPEAAFDRLIICGGDHPRPGVDAGAVASRLADCVERLSDRFRFDTVTYLSSFAVYGAPDAPPREDSPLEPLSEYGKIKAHAEALLSERLGGRLVIIRSAGVVGHAAGGRMSKSTKIVSEALDRIEQAPGGHVGLPPFNLGEVIWALDLAEITLGLEADPGGAPLVINAGSGAVLSSDTLADALSNTHPHIRFTPCGAAPPPQIPVMDGSRLKQAGFSPVADLETMVRYAEGMT